MRVTNPFRRNSAFGWMAERSKALVSGTSLFGGEGSNPSSVTLLFIVFEASCLCGRRALRTCGRTVFGWMAERSKALVSGTSLFGGEGSNPSSVTSLFIFLCYLHASAPNGFMYAPVPG